MSRHLFFLLCLISCFAEETFSIHTIAVYQYGTQACENLSEKEVWIDPALDVPKTKEGLKEALTAYLCESMTFAKIEEIEDTILCHYKKYHRPLVSVVIPPQNLSLGVLEVIVVEPKAGSVSVRGNRWTSNAFILKNSSLSQGEQINSYELQNDLAWINRSPFRQIDVVLSPGDKPGTTNAELVTQERFPLRVYAGADNTGTEFLTHTRIYAGFNAGNLWGQDHRVSFQWTTAPNPHTLTAFSGQYLAPFPWHHQLLLYGGYSQFKGDLPEPLMAQNGKAWQASGRYQVPINPLFGNLLQQFSFGYDFKRTNSELLFGGISFQGAYADINQFYLGYLLDYSTSTSKTSLTAELIASPLHITDDQNNHAYQQLRPFAKSKYAYGRLRANQTVSLYQGFEARIALAGQLTAWNLLASEQFPIGGWETVRGYEERAFNADSGVLASLEIATPQPFSKSNHFIEFLGFLDYGWGSLHKPFTRQKKTAWLLGVGPGIRYRYRANIVLRGDIGFPLHREGVERHGTHYYGGATVSY